MPQFFKPRPVPFALKEKIAEELRRLEKIGVLEKVDFSDWATPIVPVLKPDGSVRICGDYKITINPALDVPEHPMPTADDLFTQLNGGEKFTKLDLSSAYQQVLLDEELRQYVTINTHLGLYPLHVALWCCLKSCHLSEDNGFSHEWSSRRWWNS